ncbi:MAG: hypothetical protein HOJ15_00460 [Candidatus Jacksonbacteria bacterium]|jgi:uncharacterized membrane protein HdeD (DUF308 family)|nr:hypothetical protein [Candidatus Jacksonbacteria bacterium]MBT6034233.1 hypothetical protein [Candidatus Jacksonbacteria bacterium]MBT6300885.1 hypothetical protein [Candidatus Jacksonbacteria bacterium]MBT6756882.1 hypothetical protein [Candidatus Jacksonbacteria bacterium]MBT6955166.1 hypothetical protein [Candidatus Jacksonbacteria bacterium]
MELSIFLGKVVAWYLVIAGASILINRNFIKEYTKGFSKNAALLYFAGVISLIIGLMMVISHNIWASDWRVVVTIVGWLALLKGIVLLVSPSSMIKVARAWRDSIFLSISTIILVLAGIYMLYGLYF